MPLLHPGEETAVPDPGRRFERHHHWAPYAALVIRGSCEEAGDRGRFAASAGDVLVHAAFDGHSDAIGHKGAAFINLALDAPLGAPFGRMFDLDAIVRVHERDPVEAAAMLRQQFRPVDVTPRDWPDLLASDLAGAEPFSLERWADVHGLHPTSVSRGFLQAYGLSPKRYRMERITSRAARWVAASSAPLSIVAAESGFADQPHMTRSIAMLFGVTPRQLRLG